VELLLRREHPFWPAPPGAAYGITMLQVNVSRAEIGVDRNPPLGQEQTHQEEYPGVPTR